MCLTGGANVCSGVFYPLFILYSGYFVGVCLFGSLSYTVVIKANGCSSGGCDKVHREMTCNCVTVPVDCFCKGKALTEGTQSEKSLGS